MIKEEYTTKEDNSQYTYKYYDKNDPNNYVIVNKGKVVDKTTEDFIDIVEKDCGSYKRKDYKIETKEDWKKVTGYTRGDINCDYSQITNLEGAPREVGGNFDCFRAEITSLKGAPQKIGGYFDCSNTQITSLEGAPREVGGNFNCGNTLITNLRGAPSKIGRDFYCLSTQITKKQAIEYLKNNDCNTIMGDFGRIEKSDIIKESYFRY